MLRKSGILGLVLLALATCFVTAAMACQYSLVCTNPPAVDCYFNSGCSPNYGIPTGTIEASWKADLSGAGYARVYYGTQVQVWQVSTYPAIADTGIVKGNFLCAYNDCVNSPYLDGDSITPLNPECYYCVGGGSGYYATGFAYYHFNGGTSWGGYAYNSSGLAGGC
jgi:hypothetical protein